MHRIDTPNRAVDLWGAGKPGWRDGNKAGGINPTEFNALFMNGLQEEVAGVIEAAGIALDPANNAQLLAALRAAGVHQTPAQFDNTTKAATTAFVRSELLGLGNAAYTAIFGVSLAVSGYQKLPTGLIVQWGNVGVTAGTVANVTFPVAFPGGVIYHPFATVDQALSTATMFANVTRTSASAFSISLNTSAGTVHWFAIGY